MTKARDILGINARYLKYIRKYNSGEEKMFADDKLKSKRFLEARGIRVPKLIQTFSELKQPTVDMVAALPGDIVIKPNNGSRGQGIMVITEKTKNGFKTVSGDLLSFDQVVRHISNVIYGAYSMNVSSDIALIEKRIVTNEKLAQIAYKGLPDIRIIVFNGVPVMAMLRLPTKDSGGKANIDAGGVAAGIDMAKGELTHLVQYNRLVDGIPGFGSVAGFRIPFWDDILELAAKSQHISKLGYMGVDIALDKSGPMLLEINARPGLKVQIANLAPLAKRLKRVEGLKIKGPAHGIEVSKALFGRKTHQMISKLSGKTVVGHKEYVQLYYHEGPKQHLAKINPSANDNYLSKELFEYIAEHFPQAVEDGNKVKLRYHLLDKKSQTYFKPLAMPKGEFDMVLGRKALQHVLIDPYKYKKNEDPKHAPHRDGANTHVKNIAVNKTIKQWRRIDTTLAKADKAMIKHFSLTPRNLEEQRDLFIKQKGAYNPLFEYIQDETAYRHIKQDLLELSIHQNDPRGQLFHAKQQELLLKLEMMHATGRDDQAFTHYSEQLFGKVEKKRYLEASVLLQKYHEKPRDKKNRLSIAQMETFVSEFVRRQHLEHWGIKYRDTGSRMSIGKSKARNIYLRNDATFLKTEIEALMRHEIGTHALRTENAIYQPYDLLLIGTAGYLETEEGLAIYHQMQLLSDQDPKYYTPAITYTKTADVLEHSFAASAELASVQALSSSKEDDETKYGSLFHKIYRVKRGLSNTAQAGGYAKDLLYFTGYKKVKQFIADGGSVPLLYSGKFGIDDIPLIRQCDEIKPAKLLPDFLS